MPFEDARPSPAAMPFQGLAPAPDDQAPEFWGDVVPAAFRMENIIGAAMVRNRAPVMERTPQGALQYRTEEGFDPLADEVLSGYEEHADRLAMALTRAQSDAIRANIDRERADRQTLAEAGLSGMAAAMMAGTLDPTILVPVGGQVSKGASLLRNVSRFALAAGGGAAVQEAGLHALEETRTGEESAVGIAGAALLGGVLGAAATPFLRSAAGRSAVAGIEDDMRLPRDGEPDWANPMQALPADDPRPAGYYSSAGAAARDRATIDEQAIQGVLARAVGETVRLQDPVLRSITSQSLRQREIVEQLADLPAGLVKNEARWAVRTLEDGREQRYLVWGQRTEQSVESAIKLRDGMLGAASRDLDDFYIRYLRGRERRAGDILSSGVQAVTGTLPAGRMTRPDFYAAVTSAMRRGDVSDIPEVQGAAQMLRSRFFDPLKNEARDLGLFGYELRPSEDPDMPPELVPREPSIGDTAAGYVPRIYNRERIAARREEFTGRIHQHFIRRRNEAAAEAERLEVERAAVRSQTAEFWRQARSVLVERDRALREARQDVQSADRAEAAARARSREADTQSRQAGRRAAATRVNGLTAMDRSYFRGLLRDVRRGHGQERPVSLLEFVRSVGGILDEGGDLANTGAGRVNVVNNRSGRPADVIAEAASEAGYLGARTADGGFERASVNDLLDAIRDELSGRKHYSHLDHDLVEYEDMLRALDTASTEQGLNLGSISLDDFAGWIDGKRYNTATPFKRGRHQEALLREREAGARVRNAVDRLEDAEADLHDARVMARTVRETAPELTEQAEALRKAWRASRRDVDRINRELGRAEVRGDRTDAELLEDARRTVDHIMGGSQGRLSFDGPGAVKLGSIARPDNAGALSGRFKSRVLDIEDTQIEDFLESDLGYLMRATQRSMVPDIELTKRFGSIDMEVQLKEIAEEYDRLIAASPERSARLSRKKERALRDVEGMRDRLRGTYGMPADPGGVAHRTARFAVSLNYLRLMGGVTLSSIPDLARAVMNNGFMGALGAPLRALTGDLTALKKLSIELEDAGPGFELVLNNRAMAMADLMDDYGRHTKLERAVDAAQSHFGYASLIAPWNHAMKSITGYAVQNRVLRLVEAAGRGDIRPKDATFLNRLGIGADDARRMADAFARHGETVSGQRIANSRAWDDAALRERWLSALRKEVDRIIVTPGLDKPLAASSDLGRVIFQFRSYNFAATQRVLMAYLQGLEARDAHAVMALATQVGLGMVTARLKAEQYGLDTSGWTTEKWLVEGVDRSGIMGVLTDVNMMAEHVTRGNVGLSRLAGEGRLTRYQTRNALGAYLGPSFGAAQDTLTGLSGLLSGEARDSDVTALRRLMPYQNLFWLRGAFDAVEAGSADAIGAEE